MRFTKPKKGGVELPTLNNPASAENVQSGFEFIGANGNKITGTHEEEPGLDTSDATATAANIDNGKTAYINGVKVTGTSTKVNTSDATATAADIGAGVTAYGKSGKITGTSFVQSNSTPKTVTGYFDTRDKRHYYKLIVTGNPSNGTVHIEVTVGLSAYSGEKWHENLDYSI